MGLGLLRNTGDVRGESAVDLGARREGCVNGGSPRQMNPGHAWSFSSEILGGGGGGGKNSGNDEGLVGGGEASFESLLQPRPMRQEGEKHKRLDPLPTNRIRVKEPGKTAGAGGFNFLKKVPWRQWAACPEGDVEVWGWALRLCPLSHDFANGHIRHLDFFQII